MRITPKERCHVSGVCGVPCFCRLTVRVLTIGSCSRGACHLHVACLFLTKLVIEPFVTALAFSLGFRSAQTILFHKNKVPSLASCDVIKQEIVGNCRLAYVQTFWREVPVWSICACLFSQPVFLRVHVQLSMLLFVFLTCIFKFRDCITLVRVRSPKQVSVWAKSSKCIVWF
jgi:hypothetical protein